LAITNYTELQSAAQNWLDDTSFSGDRVQEFISLAEAKFNRRIRADDMEIRATASAGDEYLQLPTDFLELRGIHADGSPDEKLIYKTPQWLRTYKSADNSGSPKYYTITDGQFQFWPPPSAAKTIEIIYYGKIVNLSTASGEDTNWLLTEHPDIYLYGTLVQAEAFGWNDERAAGWKALLEESIEELHRQAAKKRQGSGPLSLSSGLVE
jgi:hypothetical protein